MSAGAAGDSKSSPSSKRRPKHRRPPPQPPPSTTTSTVRVKPEPVDDIKLFQRHRVASPRRPRREPRLCSELGFHVVRWDGLSPSTAGPRRMPRGTLAGSYAARVVVGSAATPPALEQVCFPSLVDGSRSRGAGKRARVPYLDCVTRPPGHPGREDDPAMVGRCW
ncbi:hypothetical protein MTO96_019533 [Rhipicephalus appendiculatus]